MSLRAGIPPLAKNRELPFSFFPVGRGSRGDGIYDVQFASSPWAVMRQAASACLGGLALDETLAFLEQGQDFYETARGRTAAHPLLHYYAMLNVGKAVLRVRGFTPSLEQARHGLRDTPAGTAAPDRVTLRVEGASPTRPRIFRELLQILGYNPPPAGKTYRASDLMAQVVVDTGSGVKRPPNRTVSSAGTRMFHALPPDEGGLAASIRGLANHAAARDDSEAALGAQRST